MKEFTQHLVTVLANQVKYCYAKGLISKESELDNFSSALYDEFQQLCASVVTGNALMVTDIPKGCKVAKSANFQVFYTATELTVRNKYF
jgi:hypothetical protein